MRWRHELHWVTAMATNLLGERGGPANKSPATETSPAQQMQAVRQSLDLIRGQLAELAARMDRHRELTARLEEENRNLRNHESERRQEPLIKGVAALVDDLQSLRRHAQSDAGSTDAVDWANNLLAFQDQALDVLRRNDVEMFEPRVGEPVDVRMHEVWRAKTTDSLIQDMHIADVIRLGVQFADRVIRPAAVTVYRYQPPVTDQGGTS